MLTQELNKYSPPTPPRKKGRVRAGTVEHYRAILEGVLLNIDRKEWDVGQNVATVHKPYRNGVIINISDQVTDCEWVGYKCKPIEVWFYDQNAESFMYHPNDLKEIK